MKHVSLCPLRPVEPAVLSTEVSGLKQKSKDRKVLGERGNKVPRSPSGVTIGRERPDLGLEEWRHLP